jgi:hypothetical protein
MKKICYFNDHLKESTKKKHSKQYKNHKKNTKLHKGTKEEFNQPPAEGSRRLDSL